MTPAIRALIVAEELDPAYGETVARYWRPLAAKLAQLRRERDRPVLIGVNGAQGTGKTTLCLFVEHVLAVDHGLSVATLSLDDLYLSRSARSTLASSVHPLFASRGVPGTHDVALGERTIKALLAGSRPVPLPRFDKAVDDLVPSEHWPHRMAPSDIVLFEGWCLGAEPQTNDQLLFPMNTVEELEDPEVVWRAQVNAALGGPYRRLFSAIDHLVTLSAPSFEQVVEWRLLQEEKLISRTGRGMNPAQVRRFCMLFERLTLHMYETLPARSDTLVEIDRHHRVVSATPRHPVPSQPGQMIT